MEDDDDEEEEEEYGNDNGGDDDYNDDEDIDGVDDHDENITLPTLSLVIWLWEKLVFCSEVSLEKFLKSSGFAVKRVLDSDQA